MSRIQRPALPIWIRANSRGLTAAEIEAIRGGRHLSDVNMPKSCFRALIWAGHRWAGELAYVQGPHIRGLPHMDARSYGSLYDALAELGVEIGSKARERVHVPQRR